MPRRSTKGPLEIDGPATASSSPSISRTASQTRSTTTTTDPLSMSGSIRRSAEVQTDSIGLQQDFSFLTRPEIYHPLPEDDIPPPFLTASSAPPLGTTPIELLQKGQYRHAAVQSAQILTSQPSPSPAEIFTLIYIRLISLIHLSLFPLAATESKALSDTTSAIYLDPETRQNILPWHLRVLLVRLQSVGYGDPRRGVVGYWDLGRDARARLLSLKEKDGEEETKGRKMWKRRLRDLGLRAAEGLKDMGDLEGAVRHLRTLAASSNNERGDTDLQARLALLYIQLGDVGSARRCFPSDEQPSGVNGQILSALCAMADGDYDEAVKKWQSLLDSDTYSGQEKPIITQNLAVSLLHVGELDRACSMLESLTDGAETEAFHALTFNLATLYELCAGERAVGKKRELVETVAKGTGQSGLVMRNADFKL
ncbi:MAG: hypothetical protein M1817_003002 [Caeruleum heppii]|nr:MAG: hypothetical protein M1817_003002 [Caeruleum heppii]